MKHSYKLIIPLMLALLALLAVFILPVGVGARETAFETGPTIPQVPADSPPDLEVQGIVFEGVDVQLSPPEARLPEVAANDTFAAVVFVQGAGGGTERVKLTASKGTTGWGNIVGMQDDKQSNSPRLVFNPTTTATVHIVWSGETERYIRHRACTLHESLPICDYPVSTIADAGSTNKLRQPDVAVDATGRVFVAWFDASDYEIKTAYSDDALNKIIPSSWTPGASVSVQGSDDAGRPVLAVANGYVHLAFRDKDADWEIEYRRLLTDAIYTGPTVKWVAGAPGVTDHRKMTNLAIAAADNGNANKNDDNVFLTWDNQDETDDRFYSLVGVKSENSGGDWHLVRHITSTNIASDTFQTEDEKLSGGDDAVPSSEKALRPSLTITGANEFAVVWQQRSAPEMTPGSAAIEAQSGCGTSEVHFASFSDGWDEQDGMLADNTTYYSIDPDIAVDGIGTHIVFLMAEDNGGCKGPGQDQPDYAVYYRGPITKTNRTGGIYMPIIVKQAS